MWYHSEPSEGRPLFPKPVTGQELFFAVSYSKPALEALPTASSSDLNAEKRLIFSLRAGVELNREQYFKKGKSEGSAFRIILLKIRKIQLIFVAKFFSIFGGCIENSFDVLIIDQSWTDPMNPSSHEL